MAGLLAGLGGAGLEMLTVSVQGGLELFWVALSKVHCTAAACMHISEGRFHFMTGMQRESSAGSLIWSTVQRAKFFHG